MKKSSVALFFVLIVFISSSNAIYKRLEPTIFGTDFQPLDFASSDVSLGNLFICGVVSGDYYLNINEYHGPINPLSTTGVIIKTTSLYYSTILLIPDENTQTYTTLSKIQIIDQDTTLILGTSNSTSLHATNFPKDPTIQPFLLTENNEEIYSFIITIKTSMEDEDSIDIQFTKLNSLTSDFSAEDTFYYVTNSVKGEDTSLMLYNMYNDPQEIFTSKNISSVNLVNQTLVVIAETLSDGTSVSFIDINNNNTQNSIVSILHKEDKFSIEDVSIIFEGNNIAIYFFGNYKTGANILFSNSTCDLTFVENNNDHVYIAKYVIDQSLHILDCQSISDTSNRITPTGVSLSASKKSVVLLGNFQEFGGGRGEPILQFGYNETCQKPTLSEEHPTNFVALFNTRTLECIEIGTLDSVVTTNASYPVLGTNIVIQASSPIALFYNSAITIDNKELSMGIMYRVIPLSSVPSPLPFPEWTSETSIGVIVESSSSHPRHTAHTITSYEESTEEEVVIPWYSTLIVIFLLVGAVIGTVVLYNVYSKYKRTKNNVETRKHRFARVSINDDEDNI